MNKIEAITATIKKWNEIQSALDKVTLAAGLSCDLCRWARIEQRPPQKVCDYCPLPPHLTCGSEDSTYEQFIRELNEAVGRCGCLMGELEEVLAEEQAKLAGKTVPIYKKTWDYRIGD